MKYKSNWIESIEEYSQYKKVGGKLTYANFFSDKNTSFIFFFK